MIVDLTPAQIKELCESRRYMFAGDEIEMANVKYGHLLVRWPIEAIEKERSKRVWNVVLCVVGVVLFTAAAIVIHYVGNTWQAIAATWTLATFCLFAGIRHFGVVIFTGSAMTMHDLGCCCLGRDFSITGTKDATIISRYSEPSDSEVFIEKK